MILLAQDTNLGAIKRILGEEPGLGPVFIKTDGGIGLMVIRENDGYLAYTIGTETQPDDEGYEDLQVAINNPIR